MNGSMSSSITWLLPAIDDILDYRETDKHIVDFDNERGSLIEFTLAGFNISGKIVEILHGPIITWFGVELGQISRIWSGNREGKNQAD